MSEQLWSDFLVVDRIAIPKKYVRVDESGFDMSIVLAASLENAARSPESLADLMCES